MLSTLLPFSLDFLYWLVTYNLGVGGKCFASIMDSLVDFSLIDSLLSYMSKSKYKKKGGGTVASHLP